MENRPDRIPVPEIFWSFETGRPFSRCRLCGVDLMTHGADYLIEKAFKNGETIFEHAICLPCYMHCQQELSEESRERIAAYFAEHTDMEARQLRFSQAHGTDHEKWIEHCAVKKYPVRECEEHQLYGFCSGDALLFAGAPYILSGEAIEEILDLLSNETLGTLHDLTGRLFGIDAPKDLLII